MSDNCDSTTPAGRRPRSARRTMRIAVLVLGGLLAAACGSPGDDEPSATGTADTSAGQGDERSSDVDGSTTTPDATTTTDVTASAVTTAPVETTTTNPAGTTTTVDCGQRLVRGCEGDAVVELQDLLVQGGFGNLERDGIFGPATEAALRAFEEQCGNCDRDAAIDPNGTEWSALQASEPADPDFASVFDSWVGGGDPENACWWIADLGEWPTNPTFGFGFDLNSPDEGVELFMTNRYEMCIIGLDFARPIDLRVERDGQVKNMTINAGASASVGPNEVFDLGGKPTADWEFNDPYADQLPYVVSQMDRLDDPALVGAYTVTVTQGNVALTRAVEITAGDYGDPGIRVITADDYDSWNPAAAGDTLTAVLAGFAPNSMVPLALYRGTDDFTDVGAVFEYFDTLPAATMGDQGWTYYDFVVPDVEPRDGIIWDYCVATVESLRVLYCQPYVDAVFDVTE